MDQCITTYVLHVYTMHTCSIRQSADSAMNCLVNIPIQYINTQCYIQLANIDKTLLNLLHGLLKFEIGGLDSPRQFIDTK